MGCGCGKKRQTPASEVISTDEATSWMISDEERDRQLEESMGHAIGNSSSVTRSAV